MESYSYVVIIDSSISLEDFTNVLDGMTDAVLDWYACLPNAVFVISPLDAATLAKRIREGTEVNRFLILDAYNDRNGWLPENAWKFLHHDSRDSSEKNTRRHRDGCQKG